MKPVAGDVPATGFPQRNASPHQPEQSLTRRRRLLGRCAPCRQTVLLQIRGTTAVAIVQSKLLAKGHLPNKFDVNYHDSAWIQAVQRVVDFASGTGIEHFFSLVLVRCVRSAHFPRYTHAEPTLDV